MIFDCVTAVVHACNVVLCLAKINKLKTRWTIAHLYKKWIFSQCDSSHVGKDIRIMFDRCIVLCAQWSSESKTSHGVL